jgi:hypothetical protein
MQDQLFIFEQCSKSLLQLFIFEQRSKYFLVNYSKSLVNVVNIQPIAGNAI